MKKASTLLLGLLWVVHLATTDARLATAIENRDRDGALGLLKQKADVNAPQPDGATPLHWAAHWDDVEIADVLIQHGAHVNAVNDYGVTPLALACVNGNIGMVERLLRAGANPNAALPSGETVLMTAARTGNAGVVKALLARGALVGAPEKQSGQTALMWAAAEGHTDVARLLIEHGADVRARSAGGFAPLLFAARQGDLNTTRVLLRAGATVDASAADGTTALLVATIRGHLAYAAFLLDEGANPNAGPGFGPLHWAAGQWDSEFTNASTGITGEDSEWDTLGGLRGAIKLDFVELLLAHGADPNTKATANPKYGKGGEVRGTLAGATPFWMAAAAGDVAVMRRLHGAGADPLLTTNRGVTPLMAAAGRGTSPRASRVKIADALSAVELAVELGGDVNAVDSTGNTAMHAAAYMGRDEIVRFLIERGANMNVKNKKQWTPLTIAEGVNEGTFYEFPTLTKLLRERGAWPSPPGVERDGSVVGGERER